jgi:3-oxoacyl-[acyl-carrier protein] reductase
MKNFKIIGKVIVITGGSNGIGSATAKYLFDKGANIVKADIMIKKRQLIEVSEQNYKKKMMEFPLDVRDMQSWESLFSAVAEVFGKADILINCAGILIPGSLQELNKEQIEDQLLVNLLGPITGSKVFLPLFKELNRGHIINIASLAGIAPIPYESVYSASKFGLRGFSLALAYELKNTGVKVSVICPDAVVTNQVLSEAHYENANLTFTGNLFDREYIAENIYKTILHPRKEILITPLRGLLCKIGGNSTHFMSAMLPLFDMIGRYKRNKFLNKVESEEVKKW